MRKITEEEVSRAYDSIALVYDKKRKEETIYNDYVEKPAVLSLLKNVRDKIILDLGCGTGILSKVLKKRGAIMKGIDISPKMIEIARKNVKGVEFKVGSFYNIPYKSCYFDIVVASLVMHYADDLNKSFREVRRVLKKGGTFIFSSDNPVVHVTKRIEGKPRNYRIFGDYFKEEKLYADWKIFKTKIPYQQITFQTWIRTIIKNGFEIENYIDAKAIKGAEKIDRHRYKLLSTVPWFFVVKLKKI
jgi:ubiquinone/menaquinone biosynthesis C-methylase UbiE